MLVYVQDHWQSTLQNLWRTPVIICIMAAIQKGTHFDLLRIVRVPVNRKTSLIEEDLMWVDPALTVSRVRIKAVLIQIIVDLIQKRHPTLPRVLVHLKCKWTKCHRKIWFFVVTFQAVESSTTKVRISEHIEGFTQGKNRFIVHGIDVDGDSVALMNSKDITEDTQEKNRTLVLYVEGLSVDLIIEPHT